MPSKKIKGSSSTPTLTPTTTTDAPRLSILQFDNINLPNNALANPEIPINTKIVTERFLELMLTHKEEYQKHKNKFDSHFTLDKAVENIYISELLTEHNKVIKKAYFYVQYFNLFHQVVDNLYALFFYQMKYKDDLKTMIMKTTTLEDNLEDIYNRRTNLLCKKFTLIDECKNRSFIFFVWKQTVDPAIESIQQKLQHYMTYVGQDIVLPVTLLNIFDSLQPFQTKHVLKEITNYLKDGRIDENIVKTILSMGIYTGYFGNAIHAFKIIDMANNRLKTLTNSEFRKSLLPAAKVLVNMHFQRYKSSSTILDEVLDDLFDFTQNNDYESLEILLNLAYLLDRCSSAMNGIRWMEKIEMLLQIGLPKTRNLWLKALVMIGRSYNEKREPSQAYFYLSKAIEYYHERLFGAISDTNRPISEFAAELKIGKTASSNLLASLTPKLGYLPPTVMNCFHELSVTFALNNNRSGINVVEKYIQDCKDFYKSNDIAEDLEDDEELNIRIHKINQRSSIMVAGGRKQSTTKKFEAFVKEAETSLRSSILHKK